jgi:AraC-like DNA-binding protein/quercetin dioxygenase-like cupin family protein
VRHTISRMRHNGLRTDYDPKPGASIATLAYDYPPDCQVPQHAHGAGQVIYATCGVMEVAAGQSIWLIPPQFAIWIPPREPHRIRMIGAVSMRTLYLRPKLAATLPATCTVLHVSPLLRELIIEIVRVGQLRIANRLHGALRDLVLQQLRNASTVPTFVTLPRDSRALGVAQAVMANQSAAPSLHVLCGAAGVSVRTMERLFNREVGMNFETWRRQVRLMKAIELLVAGHPVKEVAFEVGYRQPSAFVEMFRRTLGTAPKTWAAALEAPERRRLG